MSEAAFIEAIVAAPEDEALRLVYADWLEEQGDSRGELIRLEVGTRGLPRWDDAVWNCRQRRRELRAQAPPMWLEQLGYHSYRPLFDRPLPDERELRWRLMHTFIETWHGDVLTAEAGETEEEISRAEDYVASALPAAMREFYLQAGRQLRFWSFRDPTASVRQLTIPGYARLPGIEFRVGYEGGLRWYVPINTRQPDPPVRSSGDETEGSATFSEFTLFTLVYEAVWSGAVRSLRVDSSEQAEALVTESGLSRCQIKGSIWGGEIWLFEGRDILLTHTPEGVLHVSARTEAAYLELPQELRTLLDNAPRDRVDEG